MPGDTLFINKSIKLTKDEDGFYKDDKGTIYALEDNNLSIDTKSRCGIGVFSLPEAWGINDGCSPHDYAYSSPVYQAFHTRDEADQMLKAHITLVSHPVLGWLFRQVSRVFGPPLWENPKTR